MTEKRSTTMNRSSNSASSQQMDRDLDDPRQSQRQSGPGDEDKKTTIVEKSRGLSQEHTKWLQDVRGIDPEVALALGCYSGTLEFKSGRQGPGLIFPCILDDHETTWQARFDMRGKPMKGFVSGENARLNLFFGQQVWEQDYHLCDFKAMVPLADEDPDRVVVIHEGQIDAICGRMAGFVGLSLPNGTKAMDWIETWAPLLANCRRVVIWLDSDEPGTDAHTASVKAMDHLRKELWGNIYFVVQPTFEGKRIKDANDALRAGGVELVRKIVLSAKARSGGQYNIKPTKLYHPVKQFLTGIDWLDSRLVLCAGEHSAVVGRTNRGKSKFVNYLAYMAAKNNNTKCYFQSFEMVADGELTGDLAEFEMGMPIEQILPDMHLSEQALDRIGKYVVAAEPSLVPKSKDPFGACLSRIVEQAMEGVRIHVIDNYSMVQTTSKTKNENQQTKEDVIELNEILRRYDCAGIMVYHARKGDPRFSTKNLPPEIEDASGSGAIGNHCCLAVSVERVMLNGQDTTASNIAVRKARRRVHGKRCDFTAIYDLDNAQFDYFKEGFHGIEVAREKKSKADQSTDSGSLL